MLTGYSLVSFRLFYISALLSLLYVAPKPKLWPHKDQSSCYTRWNSEVPAAVRVSSISNDIRITDARLVVGPAKVIGYSVRFPNKAEEIHRV
jgi:hypothetical protein